MAENINVFMGLWDKANFPTHDAVTTNGLRQCVAVIASNGAIGHLNPDIHGKGQVNEFIRWLKCNAKPNDADIALVGGRDATNQSYIGFKISEDMVEHVKNELSKAGYNIAYEDLYGDRLRDVRLDKNGTLTITDQLDQSYQKNFTFTQREGMQGKNGRPR